VWKLDRFGSSLRHLVNALAELEALGMTFVCNSRVAAAIRRTLSRCEVGAWEKHEGDKAHHYSFTLAGEQIPLISDPTPGQPSAGLTQVSRELASALGTELRVHRFAEVSLTGRASPITKRERGDARQGDEKDRKKRVCPYTHRSLIRMIAKPHRSNHEQHERYRNDPLPIATFFEGFNILLGLKVIGFHLACLPVYQTCRSKVYLV
jgi:hypothetical protein